MNISDIKSADWALATSGIREVVEGIDDINQCIAIVLSTKKGSDPFRPTFGSDIWDWIDRPVNTALPNMKRAIFEAVGLWEPRVTVTSVSHEYQNEAGANAPVQSGIRFRVFWKLKKTQTTGQALVTLGLYDVVTKAAQQVAPVLTDFLITTETGDAITTEAGNNIVI